MTTTTTAKFRYPYTLWISPLAVFRHLNAELTGAGEAMARSNRGPQSGPQSCAEADWAVAKRAA
jgi:hypothetical protein